MHTSYLQRGSGNALLMDQMSTTFLPERIIATKKPSTRPATPCLDHPDGNSNTTGVLFDFDLNEDVPESVHCGEFASLPETQPSKQKEFLVEPSQAMALVYKIVSHKRSKFQRKRLRKWIMQSKFISIEQLIKLPNASQSQMRKKGVHRLSLHELSSRNKKKKKQKASVGPGGKTTHQQAKRKQRSSRKRTKKSLATSIEDLDETSLLLNFQRESLAMTHVASQMHLSQRPSSFTEVSELLASPESCDTLHPGKPARTAPRRSSICLNDQKPPPTASACSKRSIWPKRDVGKVADKTSLSVESLVDSKVNAVEDGKKPPQGLEIQNGAEQPKSGRRCQKCTCEGTKCLDTTCQCFMSNVFCLDCQCPGCFNQQEFVHVILRARKALDPKRKAQEAADQPSNLSSGSGGTTAHPKSCRCDKCRLQKERRSEQAKRRRAEHTKAINAENGIKKRRFEDGKDRRSEDAAKARGVDLNAGTPEDAVSLRVVHTKWCKCEICQPPNQSSLYAQSSSPVPEKSQVVHTKWCKCDLCKAKGTRPSIPDLHQPIDSADTWSMSPSGSLSVVHPKWCKCFSCMTANSGTQGHQAPIATSGFKDMTRPINSMKIRPPASNMDWPVDNFSMNASHDTTKHAGYEVAHTQWCKCDQCVTLKTSSHLRPVSPQGDSHHSGVPQVNPSVPEASNARSGVPSNLDQLLGLLSKNADVRNMVAGNRPAGHTQWCQCEHCNVAKSLSHSLQMDQARFSPFNVMSTSPRNNLMLEHIEQMYSYPTRTATPPSNRQSHNNVQPGLHSPHTTSHSDSQPISHSEGMQGVSLSHSQPAVPSIRSFQVPARTTLAPPNTMSREKWLNFSRTNTNSNFGMDNTTFKKNASGNPLGNGTSNDLVNQFLQKQQQKFFVPPKLNLTGISSGGEVFGRADMRDLQDKPVSGIGSIISSLNPATNAVLDQSASPVSNGLAGKYSTGVNFKNGIVDKINMDGYMFGAPNSPVGALDLNRNSNMKLSNNYIDLVSDHLNGRSAVTKMNTGSPSKSIVPVANGMKNSTYLPIKMLEPSSTVAMTSSKLPLTNDKDKMSLSSLKKTMAPFQSRQFKP